MSDFLRRFSLDPKIEDAFEEEILKRLNDIVFAHAVPRDLMSPPIHDVNEFRCVEVNGVWEPQQVSHERAFRSSLFSHIITY